MNSTLKKILIISIALIVIAGCGIGGYYYFSNHNEQTTPLTSVIDTNEPTETSDPLTDTFVKNYEYYAYSKIDFAFVICEVELKEGATLSDITTSTDINLSDVQSYVTTLEENQFYLGKKNVWFSLPTTSSFDGNIFIPVTDTSLTSIDLTYNDQTVTLDLTNNQANIQDLMFNSTKDTFTDDKTYEMSVSDIFEITDQDMYEDDTQLVLPSSARVFTFKVTVESLENNAVEVTSASLEDDSGFTAEAEGSSVKSMKYENMIGKTINEKDEANLFFIVLDHENKLQVTTGTLTINLNGVETPIEIRY